MDFVCDANYKYAEMKATGKLVQDNPWPLWYVKGNPLQPAVANYRLYANLLERSGNTFTVSGPYDYGTDGSGSQANAALWSFTFTKVRA